MTEILKDKLSRLEFSDADYWHENEEAWFEFENHLTILITEFNSENKGFRLLIDQYQKELKTDRDFIAVRDFIKFLRG